MATSTLDHIVHLTPPGTVQETAEQWHKLGFNVIDGGVHADGFTANTLVIIGDHTYLELIAFTQPLEAYPPGSPIWLARKSHKWATRAPGWIDYAFLGNGALEGPTRISELINETRREAGKGPLYQEETPGGRTRGDGMVLEWVITAPLKDEQSLPFFCGDVTDRQLRVPTQPDSNTHHASGARGVAHIRILVSAANFFATCEELSAVVDAPPFERASNEARWHLSTLNGLRSPTLVLTTPGDEEEAQFVKNSPVLGIYEVGFWVGEGGKMGSVMSPFGKIVWVK